MWTPTADPAYLSPRPQSDNSLRAPHEDTQASVAPERENKDQSVAPGRSLEARRPTELRQQLLLGTPAT